MPLSLNVLAEGVQAPVKPLILVELALLVPAEVSPTSRATSPTCPFSRVRSPAQRLRVSQHRPAAPRSSISWASAATFSR